MASEILTPLSVWGKFSIEQTPKSRTIGEYKDNGITLERMRIYGQSIDGETVKIYAVLARNQKKQTQPAIFVLQKFSDGADETLATYFAKKGYCAFVVNLGGEDGVNTNYTLYPEKLAYANYKNAKEHLDDVSCDDVSKTCWYQWGVTARYALNYLQAQPFVGKIGALGIDDSATVLWHMTAAEKFDALAFVMNAGWRAYKGNFKFSGTVDEQFSDEKIKYLAGIEPQAYANHIKAPTLILGATNNGDFDFDRIHDTYARITSKVYSAISYTVGGLDGVNYNAVENLNEFFKQTLCSKSQVPNVKLPTDVTIKCDLINKKIRICVTPDQKDLKEVSIFVAEEKLDPALRQWKKITNYVLEDGVYEFEYLPYQCSGQVFVFANAEYKNGFTLNSNVVCKKFEKDEVLPSPKSKVVYSSREENAEWAFYPSASINKKPNGIRLNEDYELFVKEGAMEINGVTCKSGLISFSIALEKYRPDIDGILLLDAYIKDGGKITVKLISDYFGNKTEYLANATVAGGEVWHNVKIPLNAFKTVEGMGIRAVEKIQAMEITSESEYLINNVLWV